MAPRTARFGDDTETHQEEDEQLADLVEVFEIWCAKTRKVYFFVKGMKDFLTVIDDPLQLEGFYPCPMPVFGTTTNASLVPTPDYLQYNALARELDDITARISILTKALRVRGVYDGSLQGLEALLSNTTDDNTMIGVGDMDKYWANSGAGATIQGVVMFLPVEEISKTLINLYAARDPVSYTHLTLPTIYSV